MQDTIIIIESPNKVEKIAHYTGAKVFATKGHFKELSKLIVKDYTNYEPDFELNEKKKFDINKIISECKGKKVIIATDPDREGYGIGYLFYDIIKNMAKSVERAEFFEITENGIRKGLQNAKPFATTNLKEFESWKARAVGDKLVGWILSPKYINTLNDKNISVGRVQTPALNLIVKRELEIKAFNENSENKKVEYKIKAKLKKDNIEFFAINDNIFATKDEANEQINSLKSFTQAKVYQVESKETQQKPKEPFRTSQYQEECAKKFGFSNEVAMNLAQKLFEKGLITYIRTDSNSLSADFINEVENKFSSQEWHERREYKAGSQSQAEAHEAIRISHIHDFSEIDKIASEENLSDDMKKAYTLIYTNSLLSQAKNAINQNFTFDIDINALSFKAKSTKTIYKGFKGVFESFTNDDNENKDENEIQDLELSKDELVEILGYELSEVKKKAPTHYKESNFISLLEKEKIGRPSTYATFLPKLLEREYIAIQKKGKNNEIVATNKGIEFIKTLNSNNDEWITKSEFTAHMEEILDKISNGECSYLDFIKPLHEKMEFVEIKPAEQRQPTPPSQAQIEFAKKLALNAQLELPNDIETNWKICSDFIEMAKKKQPISTPNEKQLNLAKKLADDNKVELPKDLENNWKICSDFISKYIKKSSK